MISAALLRREFSLLIKLATPLLIAQVLTSATGVVDAMMSGHYSARALAAVAVGNSVWLPLYLLMAGMLIATTTMVARFHGAKKPHNIITTVQQSIWLALAFSLVIIIILHNCQPLLRWAKLDPETLLIADGYMRAVSWGMPAAAIFNGLRGFTEGMGRARPFMISSLIAFLANIPLNYALINGIGIFPELGAVGCGWATAISFWLQVLILLCFIRTSKNFDNIRLFQYWQSPQFKEITKVMRLGSPIALAVFAEVTIFSFVALLVAGLGTTIMAGHQIALSTSHLIFMLPLALSQAVTIRAGYFLGKNDQTLANQIIAIGLGSSILLALCTITVIMLFKETIISFYTTDFGVTQVALALFFWMALYQIPDHLQIISNAALRAYHDTRIPMVLILFAYWGIALPVGYLLGRTDYLVAQPLAAKGFWMGLAIGLSVSCFLLLYRLWHIVNRRIG